MGKMVSIYLTDREAEELRRFCENHNCTQYSALKTALRELLLRPAKGIEQEGNQDESKNNQKVNNKEKSETEKQFDNADSLKRLWDLLNKTN